MEEVRSVAKSVGDEAASRAALGSSLGIQINNVVEGGKEDVARLRSDVNDQIDRMKTEENELVTQNIKRQEELKAGESVRKVEYERDLENPFVLTPSPLPPPSCGPAGKGSVRNAWCGQRKSRQDKGCARGGYQG